MQQEFYQPGDLVADFLFNWLPLLGALFFGCVGLVLILRGYAHYVNSVLLKRAGQPGRARVVQKWVKKGYVDRDERHRTPAIKHYFLRYELVGGPRPFCVKEVAPIDLWRQVEQGDEVDVIFHPRRRLMRLAAWTNYSGTNAGAAQMVMGAVLMSSTIAMILVGAYGAFRGPDIKHAGDGWVPDRAEVLQIGTPADPFLRLFAPGSKMIRVVFGDTHGGAFVANQREIWVTAEQIEAFDVAEGAILAASLNPDNEYDALLELEQAYWEY